MRSEGVGSVPFLADRFIEVCKLIWWPSVVHMETYGSEEYSSVKDVYIPLCGEYTR